VLIDFNAQLSALKKLVEYICHHYNKNNYKGGSYSFSLDPSVL